MPSSFFCPECAHRHVEGRPEHCENCGVRMQYGKRKRKRTQRKSNFNSHDRREVMRWLRVRYGDLCWLCGLPMDFDLDSEHPRAPSVDHLLPVSKLGSNRRSNLRLAHKDCNRERGDAPA